VKKLWVYEEILNEAPTINPIIMLRRGENFKASFRNEIPRETIIHWHGLTVDWRNDGHPYYAIDHGGSYEYEFTVNNRGGTYWYHPHPHPAAEQIYKGLASFFIIEDSDEDALRQSLDLTLGKTDIPLLIQDKRFEQGDQLTYDPNPMERLMGFLGDTVLVNLTLKPYLDVDTRYYRFRILNGSTARICKLAFVKNEKRLPFHIIGVDGGLLEKPELVDEVFIAPAERVDAVLDLRSLSQGDIVFLKSLGFDPMHMEMMMGSVMNHVETGSKLLEGEDFFLLKLIVRNKVAYDGEIPQKLSIIEPINTTNATERAIHLSSSMGAQMMQWLINGHTFNMDSYPIQLKRDTVEIWKIINMPQSMPHPTHIHGYQFQVLNRINSPPEINRLRTDNRGRIPTDLGWKDTMLIWPGETVKIAIDFTTRFAGDQKYLFHCHNLEHQDNGMMINLKVT